MAEAADTAPIEPVAAVETVAPAAETPAESVVVETPALHTDTASLLEEVTAAPSADAPKSTEPTADAPVELAAPTLPTYEPFTLPEGLTAAPEKMAAYTEILGQSNIPQEIGQRLIDLHTTALREFVDHTATEQHRAFAETRRAWREEIAADERLGGAAFETTKRAVARMRDLLVPQAEREGFDQFLRHTGAGDNPAFWRLLANAARYFDEPTLPPPNAKPPADIGRAPKNAGRRMLYDHPSSTRAQ